MGMRSTVCFVSATFRRKVLRNSPRKEEAIPSTPSHRGKAVSSMNSVDLQSPPVREELKLNSSLTAIIQWSQWHLESFHLPIGSSVWTVSICASVASGSTALPSRLDLLTLERITASLSPLRIGLRHRWRRYSALRRNCPIIRPTLSTIPNSTIYLPLPLSFLSK